MACVLIAALAASLLAAPAAAGESPAAQATQLVNQGRIEEAVPSFEEALRREPSNGTLHLGLGLACQRLRRYAQAIASLEKAKRLLPASEEPVYSLALLYEAAAADPASVETAEAAGKTPQERARLYRLRAAEAWRGVLRLTADPKRAEAARRHLEGLAG